MGNLKTKLKQNDLIIGTWITIASTAVAEILCQAGFDWVAIDMEHSPISFAEAQELIRTIDLCGKAPAVRVGENNEYQIKNVLDAGARAIVVPMVNSKEEAEAAVRAVKYPPAGKRGVGLGRAQKYGFGFDEYRAWNERESVVVVQIEHIDAVRNLEGILEVEGIDATFVGPYDLSGSLGQPGNFHMPEFKQALAEYETLSKKHKMPMGYHVGSPDAKLAESKAASGYRLLTVSSDAMFMGQKCRETLAGMLY
ncbi:MAG: aldolase/citrate lyase family protein [Clostridiales bacterium]|nr:aldolase/citrate lyase family protein [Clostridiales bacterium]